MYIYLIQKYSDVLLQNDVYKIGVSLSVNGILTAEATQNSAIHIMYYVEDSEAAKEYEYVKNHFDKSFTHIAKSSISSFGEGIYKGDITKLKLAFMDAITLYTAELKKNSSKPIFETTNRILDSDRVIESMSTETTNPAYSLVDLDEDLDTDMIEYTDGDDMLDCGVEKDIVDETLQQKTNFEVNSIMDEIVESIKQQYLKECTNVDTTISTAQMESK